MANIDKAVKAASDTPQKASSDLEWVVIPDKDILDFNHPGVAINRDSYGPGKHLVPADIAQEIRERLAIYDAQTIRILQPRKDMKALIDLHKSRGPQAVDMTRDLTKEV